MPRVWEDLQHLEQPRQAQADPQVRMIKCKLLQIWIMIYFTSEVNFEKVTCNQSLHSYSFLLSWYPHGFYPCIRTDLWRTRKLGSARTVTRPMSPCRPSPCTSARITRAASAPTAESASLGLGFCRGISELTQVKRNMNNLETMTYMFN